MRAALVLIAVLAGTACECGDDPSGGPRDVSILFGEGPLDFDDGGVSTDALDPFDQGAPDQALLDEGPSDVAGLDAARDAGDPCVLEPVERLSAEAALRRASALAGQVVRVDGIPSAEVAECSAEPCPDGGACCRRCRASLFIDGLLLLAESECTGTSTVGCVGTPCDPLVCAPPAFGAPGGYIGRLQSGEEPRLELFRVAP